MIEERTGVELGRHGDSGPGKQRWQTRRGTGFAMFGMLII
ncbi:hypothetical protein TI01_2322 [Lysobacter sp. A03]|nr:hypothetical protein TI01_2322 [Lysobacter sp. A03]